VLASLGSSLTKRPATSWTTPARKWRRPLIPQVERFKALPTENERKHWLAFAHERIGDTFLRSSRAAEAAKEFVSAAQLYKEVADSDPKNVDAQADLSRTLYSQGLAAERTGDKAGAAKHFRRRSTFAAAE
jgi:hypothetical protein